MSDIRVFENTELLNEAAAKLLVQIANRAIEERGRFAIAMSGGSTPKSLYRLLAEKFLNAVDWSNVYFFFGDERNVSLDAPESNYRMARETLLSRLTLRPDNVRPWPIRPDEAAKVASEYQLEIRRFFTDVPRFDLILLGLGSDCHTASLFPNTAAIHEREKLAVANWVEKLDDYRLTITFPVINNAANVMFLVAGAEKAEAVAKVLEGEFQPDEFPAQYVEPANGSLYWLLDTEAAAKLKG